VDPRGHYTAGTRKGGVDNILTADPSDMFEASGAIELSNYHLLRGSGMVNAPLTDNSALRIVFTHYDHDPYFTGAGGESKASCRVKYLYHPSDAVRFLVGGEFLKQGSSPYAPASQRTTLPLTMSLASFTSMLRHRTGNSIQAKSCRTC